MTRDLILPDLDKDFETIISGKRYEIQPSLQRFIESDHYLNPIKEKALELLDQPSIVTKTKMGPNGLNFISSHKDLFSMSRSYRKDLAKLESMVYIRPRYQELLTSQDLCLTDFKEGVQSAKISHKRHAVPRRVTQIHDKEGKTRTIAIPDLFTQSVLKGLHTAVSRMLGHLSNDCTYDHGKFTTILDTTSLLSDDDVWYSVDLKSATDLMPSKLAAEVLNQLCKTPKTGDQ